MKRTAIHVLVLAAFATSAMGCGGDSKSSDSKPKKKDSSSSALEQSDSKPRESSSSAPQALADQSTPPAFNGITVNGDDLWIASIGGQQVLRANRFTGLITGRWGADEGLAGPDDVAVAEDGSVIITDLLGGAVKHLDPATNTISVIAQIDQRVNPVAISSEGLIYTSWEGSDAKLLEIAKDGTVRTVVDPSNGMNGFSIYEGMLYAPSGGLAGPGGVQKVDLASGEVEQIASELPVVVAVHVSSDGRIFALTVAEGLIEIMPDGTTAPGPTVPAVIPDNFGISADGSFYVTSFTSPVVSVHCANGNEAILEIGNPGQTVCAS